jgi:hypothetical protein
MTEHSYTVEVQPDFLERQTKANPVQAVAELIWNGLDADATRIHVQLVYGELGMTKIVVRDNGHGIPFEDAPNLFTRLGGSWKKSGGLTKTKHRMLHGYEGRGRFKAFALGRVADWHVTYRTDTGALHGYDITMLEDNIREVRITDDQDVAAGESGVQVEVSELHQEFRSLKPGQARQELAEIFALYLKDYRDISILYERRRVDPDAVIAATRTARLSDIDDDGETHPVELEIIEWRTVTTRALYLCTEQGFPLSKVATRFHVGEFHFSAYLKSPFITKLHGEAQLDLAEMNPLLNDCIEEAQQTVKAYFRERAAERARSVVDEWKAENIYPYEGDAQSPLEDAERKVFDIVAVTASDYMPDFQNAPVKKKAFDLRMLRTAIEKSPHELPIIMNEVLGLPKRKQEELAGLLQETSLSSNISAAKLVADRLKFLSSLELILLDAGMRKRGRERSQLHQILADNTWLFGEEYNLSVSDKSLTEVLRKHRKLLGDDVIDRPVRHIAKARGIVDLMLSRALHRADELEHLVVELKAPHVTIGKDEVNQTEEYAFSVMDDERFKQNNVRWTFWVISDDMDSFAEKRILEHEQQHGTIYRKGSSVIAIKTWSQIIEDNKTRLQFFQERLQHRVDDQTALKYLQDKYDKFLARVVTDEDRTIRRAGSSRL